MGDDLVLASLDDWLNWLEQEQPSHVITLGLGRIDCVAGYLLYERPIAQHVITVLLVNWYK